MKNIFFLILVTMIGSVFGGTDDKDTKKDLITGSAAVAIGAISYKELNIAYDFTSTHLKSPTPFLTQKDIEKFKKIKMISGPAKLLSLVTIGLGLIKLGEVANSYDKSIQNHSRLLDNRNASPDKSEEKNIFDRFLNRVTSL